MSTAEASKQSIPGWAYGTGRRKTSVARVRVRPGSGVITVNGRPMNEYFPLERDQADVLIGLEKTDHVNKVDVFVSVSGGGLTGQSGAIKMGMARALIEHDGQLEPTLREHHLLTRDGRMKERKKYGRRGARKGTQFSKR